ncbi:MAG: hypothetical protein ACRD1T_23660, partial [Acidimicrobiia bacterium]
LTRLDYAGGERTTLRLGADIKVLALRANESLPLDVAIGGGLGVETSDDFSVLTVMPSVVASHTFGGQTAVIPYGSLGFAFANVDVGPLDTTDFSIPLRLGSEFRVAAGFGLAAELQINLGDSFSDDYGILVGANMPF